MNDQPTYRRLGRGSRRMLSMRLSAALVLCSLPVAAQWHLQNSLTSADLRGIHAVSPEIAWASGTNGTVLRTTDSGVHWALCAIPPGAEKLDFRGIQAFDAQTAVVMSSGKGPLSRIYKTVDACITWTLLLTNPDPEGFWDAMSFYKLSEGVQNRAFFFGTLIGDPVNGAFSIFQTTDGVNWSRRIATKRGPGGEGCKLDPFVSKKDEALFAASNQALINFGPTNFVFVTGGSTTRLAYTDHFDLDFALCHDSSAFVELPMAHGNRSSGAFAVAAKTAESLLPLKLMIVGGDYAHPDNANGTSAYFLSRDGFHVPFTSYFDMVPAHTPPHGFRSSVAYSPASRTWITVGPNGTDISTDDGRNWSAVRPSSGEAPDSDRNWNALSLPYVVGPQGRIGKLKPTALSHQDPAIR